MRTLLLGLIVALLATVVACGDDSPSLTPAVPVVASATPELTATPIPSATPTPEATASPTPSPTPTTIPTPSPTSTATPVPTPTPQPTPTPTASPLSAAQVFARVSPSVAFIETPAFTGSGVLIDGGYVVTNAHVVWPFGKVRVVFPDGSEFLDAPVLDSDLLDDLAVIGPLDTAIEPAQLVDGEDLVTGSDVFLIGYPGESEEFPQPTITRGIISRQRQWDAISMTYFQTDATIAGGQSGGALVSENGEVIGISGLTFTEAGFGLAASASDVRIQVRSLIEGADTVVLGDRGIPLDGSLVAPGTTDEIVLDNIWHGLAYVVNEPAGTLVEVAVASDADIRLVVVDVWGNEVLSVDEQLSDVPEVVSWTTEVAAPYFVVPSLAVDLDGPVKVQIESNRSLRRFVDPDDGITVAAGQTVFASIDHPFDFDYFTIELDEEETVEVEVDSALVNPYLWIDFIGATEAQLVEDDDSGGGVVGLGAKVTYRAPHTGSYLIIVSDASFATQGGYVLTVERAPPGAAAVSPPMAEERETVDSPFGPMTVYQSAQNFFSIQYPAGWAKQPNEQGITASFTGDDTGFLVAEEDLATLGLGRLTLAQYVDAIIASASASGAELVSREDHVTPQGLSAEILEFTLLAGVLRGKRIVYLHEETVGFSATYVAPNAGFGGLEDLIEYSFSTFTVADLADIAEVPSEPKHYSEPPPVTIDPDKKYTATFEMENAGRFVVELFANEALRTVNNFVFLAQEGFYDGVTFHRVIPGFMAQSGDPTGTGRGGPGYMFADEFSPALSHDGPGVLSMANAGGIDTNGSQFFITFVETKFLDPFEADGMPKNCEASGVSCHLVFGRVIEGMEVVNGIAPRDPSAATTPGDAISSITIEEDALGLSERSLYPPMWYISTFSRGSVIDARCSE